MVELQLAIVAIQLNYSVKDTYLFVFPPFKHKILCLQNKNMFFNVSHYVRVKFQKDALIEQQETNIQVSIPNN